MVSVKIYEKFLECFDYTFPDEKRVVELFENRKLQELIKMICPADCSRTRQLILVQQLTEDIRTDLATIARMHKQLSVPQSDNPLPKITFSLEFKLDELISLRRIRKTLDDAGFTDDKGKSMYFEMPLTSAFYIYFKTLAAN